MTVNVEVVHRRRGRTLSEAAVADCLKTGAAERFPVR